MIPIMISISNSRYASHDGERLPRFADDDEDNVLDETSDQFLTRKKKRSRKVTRRISVPKRQTLDQYEQDIKVSKANWLGRMEREGARKKSRIRVRE